MTVAAHPGQSDDVQERLVVDQAVRALAIRLQCEITDAHRHLILLARDAGITEAEMAAALLEGREQVTGGVDLEIFDSAKYLRRLHPGATGPGALPDRPPAPRELPEPPEWIEDALAAIPVNAAYAVPLRTGGEIVDFVSVRINDRIRTLTGAPAEELLGLRLLDLDPNLLGSGLLQQLAHVQETGKPLVRGPFEYMSFQNGRLVPTTVTVRAARAGPGLLVSWSLQREMRRLRARWEESERLAGLGWCEWDLFTDEIVWTRKMYDIYDRDPAAGPLRVDDLPDVVLEEDLPQLAEALRTLLEYREAAIVEFRIRLRSGIRHLNVMLEPVLDADAELLAIHLLTQDVTTRHRRERVLAATHQRMLDERRRAEEERRFAMRLREMILPLGGFPVSLPGMVVGLRYLTADSIGGDWHKVHLLPDGRVLLAIGDAMGHGLQAATLMAQMRAGLAGLAYTGAEADRLMSWLNELVRAEAIGDIGTGTAVLGHFDPDRCALCWVCAGHPPPILVRGTMARLLETEPGPMLGVVENPEYPLISTPLEPGDLLLLYTDGVVDRRDRDVDTATAGLLEAAAGATGTLEERLTRIIEAVGADRMEDDVCLMAAQIC